MGDTADAFAAHLVSLLQDEAQRHQLAANGYAFVHARYSWEQACNKLEAILQSLCGKESLVAKEKGTNKKED